MRYFIFFFLLISASTFSQKNLKQLLKKYNTESVPYIFVNELVQEKEVILLDSREPKEYKVSHIKNAICVGYDNFNLKETLNKLPENKETKIVVYCSLGIRSEDVAEQLKKDGYTNVYNLYGGIFEWKNQDKIVVNPKNNPTEKVHTFNKDWSKWLHKGIKVFEK